MRVAIGADHAGFPLKDTLRKRVEALGHTAIDLGARELRPHDDYPDFAFAIARAVVDGRAERGVILCGSGVGASIAANKVAGIRAAVCHDTYSARQGVEHDDMNVLALGTRVIGSSLMEAIVHAFLCAAFTGEERHARRLEKVKAIEAAGSAVKQEMHGQQMERGRRE